MQKTKGDCQSGDHGNTQTGDRDVWQCDWPMGGLFPLTRAELRPNGAVWLRIMLSRNEGAKSLVAIRLRVRRPLLQLASQGQGVFESHLPLHPFTFPFPFTSSRFPPTSFFASNTIHSQLLTSIRIVEAPFIRSFI